MRAACWRSRTQRLIDQIEKHVDDSGGGSMDYIVVLDLYSVHRSEAVLTNVRICHPRCHLAFIGAHTTPWCQPLDIAYNGPLKRIVRGRVTEHFGRNVVAACRKEEAAVLDFRIGTMRPLLAEWVVSAFVELDGRGELHSRAWREYQATTDEEHMQMLDEAHKAQQNGTLFSDLPLDVVKEHEYEVPPEGYTESNAEENDEDGEEEDQLPDVATTVVEEGAVPPPKKARTTPEEMEDKKEAAEARKVYTKAEKCGFLAAIYGRYTSRRL